MHKIVCTIGAFAEEARNILRPLGTLRCCGMTDAELARAAKGATILIVRIGNVVDKKLLASAQKLRYIATPTTGTDHIDLEACEQRGITVISLKHETAFLKTITSTAELALGLMISLVRSIPGAHADVLIGKWNRHVHAGSSLAGKTLGVVGYGRLGIMMGRYGKALGMRVLFTDPAVKGGVPLHTLLKESDIVSLHVHLTDKTRHMIGTQELRRMKHGARLINTSRGAIVDEAAVIAALREKTLGGYATDVLESETHVGGTADSPLIRYAKSNANVILTPHIGGNTAEARRATDIFIAKKLLAVLTKRTKRA